MPDSLPRHFCERDVRLVRAVTSGLSACLLHRLEPVQIRAVTFHALEILERARVRFEMHAVSGRRRDSLPPRCVLRDVTFFADGVWNVRMLLDLFRPFCDPQIQLVCARVNRLLMTLVT